MPTVQQMLNVILMLNCFTLMLIIIAIKMLEKIKDKK